jgi:hypothetical protein
MRNHPDLDSGPSAGIVRFDIDILIHRYLMLNDKRGSREIQCLMFVEVKTYNAKPTTTQQDTLSLFSQVLRNRKTNMHRKRRGMHAEDHIAPTIAISRIRNKRVRLRMFGGHLLQLSNDDPTTSELRWDLKHKISIEQLVKLLRFELDPDNPTMPIDWRRRYSDFENWKKRCEEGRSLREAEKRSEFPFMKDLRQQDE